VGTLRALVGEPTPVVRGIGGHLVRWPAQTEPDIPERAGSVTLIAASAGWLRRGASSPLAWVTSRHVRIIVSAWTPPAPGWSGRLGPLPGLLRHRVRLSTMRQGRVVVEVSLVRPQPLHLVMAAALDVVAPSPSMPAPVSADVATYGPIPGWLPASTNTAAFVGPAPDDKIIRPYDVLLTEPDDGMPVLPGVAAVRAESSGVSAGDEHTILVDAATSNPRGWRPPEPDAPAGALRVDADRWSVTGEGELADGPLAVTQLDERQLAAVRSLRAIDVDRLDGDPAQSAALLAELAMTGAVLTAQGLPAATADLLSPQLRGILAEPLPSATAAPIEWEIRSVRQRREALRRHATGLALPMAVGVVPATQQLPTVSALLVTMRPERLPAAIATLQQQTYPDVEIVLGLHGSDAPPEVTRAIAECPRPVEVVRIPAERSFGEALGEVTARARGTLVTKIDDDDRYGPEHIWDLVLGRHYSGATVVGKAAEFVFLEALGITVRRSRLNAEAYAPTVAGGTILIARGDLESVGGWRPLARSVDRGLLDRVKRDGGLTYRTHGLGFVYTRRPRGHTWDSGLDHFLHESGPQWTGLPQYAEFGTVHARQSIVD
jgi:hypothetical protein